jgi:GAF domain-containing protein
VEQPSTVLQPPGTDPVARAEALLALTDLLARTTDDLPVLLRTAAETIARLCGDTAGVWLVEGPDDERAMRVRAWWHVDPRARADMAALGADVRLPEHEPGFLWTVATRGPVLLPRVRIEDLRGVNAAYLTYFRRWGLASMVLVPLRARDRLLGLLGVSRDTAGAPYDDQDLAFAVRVGTHLSLALDNARLVAEVRQELRDRIGAEEALRHQADHDALTGLANRVQLRSPRRSSGPRPRGAPRRRPRRLQGGQRRAGARGR